MVRVAENKYKSTHGYYAALSQLRKAHLLDELVFESDSPRNPQSRSAANYVPTTTIFEIILSSDGQHFRASIHEKAASVAAGEQAAGRSSAGRSLMTVLIHQSSMGPKDQPSRVNITIPVLNGLFSTFLGA
jgi:hypothetical protein